MKKLLIIFVFFTLLTSCMVNNDYHTHRIHINTQLNTIEVEGKKEGFATYVIEDDNIGITIYFPEHIDSFTWVFDILDDNIKYNVELERTSEGTTIYIPHNFNEYPMGDEPFLGITYLVEEHLHFITNLT